MFVYPIYGARGGVVVKATNWQVAGSIPDGVIEVFQWHNPAGRTMYGPGVDSASNRWFSLV